MEEFFNSISQSIIKLSDFLCGYPEFFLLIGGGLFLFIYSGGVSIKRLPWSVRALRQKQAKSAGKDTGQISSFQALMSAIAATVGMGNIAGVAIALSIGGPGVIFWMWVSAIVGMGTKFFEGTLAIMYKGRDSEGVVQGGPMYMITQGLGKKWKPLAVAFSIFGLVGTLCFMQANQLVESITTVFTSPMGIENTVGLRFTLGVVIVLIVGTVIIGGINRIAKTAARVVPLMVTLYLILVVVIMVLNYDQVPGVFKQIIDGAFHPSGIAGGVVGIALTGARRAAMVNEAGVGTASMMHGASMNTEPVREGLVAMIAPLIASGIVCTLTSIPIILAGQNIGTGEVSGGLYIALGAFGQLLPHVGQYLLMIIVFFFAFSTMFSYSYYGQKCTNYLFGAKNAKYYNYYYLAMIIVAAVIKLDLLVSCMDLAFFLMAVCTMFTLLALSPRVKREMKAYFARHEQ